MTSPFHAWAHDYKARGFSPLPVNPGGKVPGQGGKYNLKEWQHFCEAPASDWQLGKWMRSANHLGITLACGYGGLIGVDVDDPRAYAAVKQVLGHIHPPAKIGQRGATAFFFDPTGLIKNKNICEARPDGTIGGTLVEFLSKGRQSIIPPTIHAKTGREYRWKNDTLAGMRPAEAPVITQGMIDEIIMILEPLTYKSKSGYVEIEDTGIKPENLTERMHKRMQAVADKVFDTQVGLVEGATRPGRNRTLYNGVLAVGKYVHNGYLSASDVTADFLAACKTNKLTDDDGETDVRKTIKNALEWSKRYSLPDLDKEH